MGFIQCQGQRSCGIPLTLRTKLEFSGLSAGTDTLIFNGIRGFSASNLNRLSALARIKQSTKAMASNQYFWADSKT